MGKALNHFLDLNEIPTKELRNILAEAAYKPDCVLSELAHLRSLTPPGSRPLAEDLVREGRDER